MIDHEPSQSNPRQSKDDQKLSDFARKQDVEIILKRLEHLGYSLQKSEVVRIIYERDPDSISYEDLVTQAQSSEQQIDEAQLKVILQSLLEKMMIIDVTQGATPQNGGGPMLPRIPTFNSTPRPGAHYQITLTLFK